MAMWFNRLFQQSSTNEASSSFQEVSSLPRIMPENLKIKISSSAIFTRRSESIEIENGTVVIKNESKEGSRHSKFPVSSSTLEVLYQILKKNNFEKIKIKDIVSLDYPSQSIELSWGNSFFLKGESQTKQIDKKWDETFRNCRFDLIEELCNTIKGSLRALKVIVADELILPHAMMVLSSNDSIAPYFYQSNNTQPDDFLYLPGYSELNVEPGKNSGRSACIIFLPTGNFSALHIYLEGDQLKWRVD